MSSALDDRVKHKSHRDRNAGRKAEKKKAKKEHVQELSDKQKNPKAFGFQSAVRAERRFRRKQDIETKKQHIPAVDRTPLEPPPTLVAVIGPPKVGKSLVIQCLIKHSINQPVTNIVGPVTVVSGKKQRITFLECNNDVNSMIDIAKVADLVLLLVDASFGKWEMEVFEFLIMCETHGMPRIIGVMTHLDVIKDVSKMRKVKKSLKQRFWSEVFPGAKLFHLSGLLHDEYLRTEIKNLARYISVQKFRPLTWRTTHPYMLVDRLEDLTSPELIRKNPKVDRNISLYGYVRGIPLNKDTSIHIPGCGDMKIKDLNFLPDPCPLPEHIKKRALVEKERLIYAPFSGVGGIVYDKDAVYVELGGSHSYKEDNTGLAGALMDTQETLDQKLQHSELRLFSNSAPIKSRDVNESMAPYTSELVTENERVQQISEKTNEKGVKRKVIEEDHIQKKKKKDSVNSSIENDDIDLDELTNDKKMDIPQENAEVYHSLSSESDKLKIKNKISEALNLLEAKKDVKQDTIKDDESFDEFSDEDSRAGLEMNIEDQFDYLEESTSEEEDIDMDESEKIADEFKWKRNLTEKAEEAFKNRQKRNRNLMKMVYGVANKNKTLEEENEDEEDKKPGEDIGGIFRVAQEQQKQKIQERELQNQEESVFWPESPRDWLKEENKKLLMKRFVTGKWKESEDADELLKQDDEKLYGDFEDLETGEKYKAEDATSKELSVDEEEEKKKLLKKKQKLKEKFNAEYDNTEKKTYYDELKADAEKQADINKSEFEGLDDDTRVQLEGYRPGMYVRVEVESVPCELITHFEPTYPIIIGGQLHGEENIGYMQALLKKHRWYSGVLKSRDPIIFSLGWRRFQTMPIYSKLEDNLHHRMLKYTPEHQDCMGHFWGPITPQSTGILAVQDVSSKERRFRIAGVGHIVESDKNKHVEKKLKLIGTPMKIYRKTAFIKDMFNSALEVAKFEGARIQTVSGIRGQVKRAIAKPEGCFRATFEDKIMPSDIVFCRTWCKIDIPHFYNPITSLLLPPAEKNQWRGMKTIGQLKRESNIRAEANKDSSYTPVERDDKVCKPLFIPRKLQKQLPYKDKPKLGSVPHLRKPDFKQGRVAVVREPEEQNFARIMRQVRANYARRKREESIAMTRRMTAYEKKVAEEEAKKKQKHREMAREIFKGFHKIIERRKKLRETSNRTITD